jgi:hypothetical protein
VLTTGLGTLALTASARGQAQNAAIAPGGDPLPDRASSATTDEAAPSARTTAPADPRDAALLGGGGLTGDAPGQTDPTPEARSGEQAPAARRGEEPTAHDDPLRIGGSIYLRSYVAITRGQRLRDLSFGTPMLLDVYLDARPSERVRGFSLGRVAYDPSLPPTVSGVPGSGGGQFSGIETSGRPQGSIDQLWLNFDVARLLFVTVGKQHVRWGTARVWAPTDFLHLRPRNPLDTFDARAGRTMLKLHLPVESKAWNFYAYALTENERGTASVARVAGAARAELTFGTTELALGVFARRGDLPKLAADVSTSLGDFDLYAEAALLDAGAVDRTRWDPEAVVPAALPPPTWQTPDEASAERIAEVVEVVYPTYRDRGYRAQIVAGTSYSLRYNDSDAVTLGAEYFYNQLGYENSDAYVGLFLPRSVPLSGAASFFYIGRHYGALSAHLPAPFSWDLHSFSLTTLGNFSDRSFITRLDYAYTLLTHLTFEAFSSVRYGRSVGEFRFGVNSVDLDGVSLSLPPRLLDLGIGLRLSI